MRSAIAQPVAAAIPEKPITFTAFSIRQTMAGRKTVTRRIVNLEHLKVRLPYEVKSDLPAIIAPRSALPGPRSAALNPQGAVSVRTADGELLGVKPGEFDFICPYVTGTTRLVDDGWRIEPHGEQRLWVRETHAQFAVGNRERNAPLCVAYRATCDEDGGFNYVNNGDEAMRIKVTKWTSPRFLKRQHARLFLRVSEVQIERLQEITEEGALAEGYERREHFAKAWDEMHGAGAFEADPFVWAITYSVVQSGAAR